MRGKRPEGGIPGAPEKTVPRGLFQPAGDVYGIELAEMHRSRTYR